MTLTILRYSNRKLYIPRSVNVAFKDIITIGRYTTLPDIVKILDDNKNLQIKVQNQKGQDITKRTLYACLKSQFFTLGDLYNLVREQALGISVLNSAKLGLESYRSEVEL